MTNEQIARECAEPIIHSLLRRLMVESDAMPLREGFQYIIITGEPRKRIGLPMDGAIDDVVSICKVVIAAALDKAVAEREQQIAALTEENGRLKQAVDDRMEKWGESVKIISDLAVNELSLKARLKEAEGFIRGFVDCDVVETDIKAIKSGYVMAYEEGAFQFIRDLKKRARAYRAKYPQKGGDSEAE